MRIRWTLILITAALVFWFFAAAAVARAQECPTKGYLLAAGESIENVTPLAHGPLIAWVREGWHWSEDGVEAKALFSKQGDYVVLQSYVKSETGAWLLRKTIAFAPHPLMPCLLKSVEPVTTNGETGEPIYLFFGHAPALADHDHTDVQSINVVNVPELKRS